MARTMCTVIAVFTPEAGLDCEQLREELKTLIREFNRPDTNSVVCIEFTGTGED